MESLAWGADKTLWYPDKLLFLGSQNIFQFNLISFKLHWLWFLLNFKIKWKTKGKERALRISPSPLCESLNTAKAGGGYRGRRGGNNCESQSLFFPCFYVSACQSKSVPLLGLLEGSPLGWSLLPAEGSGSIKELKDMFWGKFHPLTRLILLRVLEES